MKKYMFFPVFLLLVSCAQPENKAQKNESTKITREILSGYVRIGNFQQAWTKSYMNYLFLIHNPGPCTQKEEFRAFINKDYPDMKLEIKKLIDNKLFAEDLKKSLDQMDVLIAGYKNAEAALPDFASYNDPAIMLQLDSQAYDTDGENLFRFEQLNHDLGELKENFRNALNEQIQK